MGRDFHQRTAGLQHKSRRVMGGFGMAVTVAVTVAVTTITMPMLGHQYR
jgi:hypothetical protein